MSKERLRALLVEVLDKFPQAAAYLDPRTLETVDAKTVGYYTRAMWAATLDLSRGTIDARGFEDTMLGLIEGQFKRAWNEGMRNVGLDNQSRVCHYSILPALTRIIRRGAYGARS